MLRADLYFSQDCFIHLYIHMLRIFTMATISTERVLQSESENITGTCLFTGISSFLDNSPGHQALPAVYGKIVRLYFKGIAHD